jgi:predicted neuraminidase
MRRRAIIPALVSAGAALPAMAALAVAGPPPTPPSSAAPPGVIVAREFIFESAPFASAHASTLVETTEGLVAAWFGGTAEGKPDVGIWLARRGRDGWSPPVEVARCAEGDGTPRPCWNPVLFRPTHGPLVLFYRAGRSPREWRTLGRTSSDGGRTWSAPTPLPPGVLGPIRAKPVELPDGTVLAGSSTEDHGWIARVERWTPPDLSSPAAWKTSAPLNDPARFEAIQPTILVHSPSVLQALCRSRQRVITQTWSRDGGLTWSTMSATTLPNPSAGIDAVRLADGRFLLAHNPTASGRSRLVLAVSGDGREWRPAVTLEDGDKGEYSYPALVVTGDGRVHATYTWRRQRIRHVVVDPAAIR